MTEPTKNTEHEHDEDCIGVHVYALKADGSIEDLSPKRSEIDDAKVQASSKAAEKVAAELLENWLLEPDSTVDVTTNPAYVAFARLAADQPLMVLDATLRQARDVILDDNGMAGEVLERTDILDMDIQTRPQGIPLLSTVMRWVAIKATEDRQMRTNALLQQMEYALDVGKLMPALCTLIDVTARVKVGQSKVRIEKRRPGLN